MTNLNPRYPVFVIRSIQLLFALIMVPMFIFLIMKVSTESSINQAAFADNNLMMATTWCAVSIAYYLTTLCVLAYVSSLLLRIWFCIMEMFIIVSLTLEQSFLFRGGLPSSCETLAPQYLNQKDLAFGPPGDPGRLDKYCPLMKCAFYLNLFQMLVLDSPHPARACSLTSALAVFC
jgi:hypothetical protein